jgi:GT2 family glycosyltransferase
MPAAAKRTERDVVAPAVSVIVAAYQSHATIMQCLGCLERQTFEDFEVIVVDSSPDERTARLLERAPAKVRFERSADRLLPHAARNAAARLARGRVLVSTDPDCLPDPRWLSELVGAVDSANPVAGGGLGCAGSGWFERGVHLCKFSSLLPGNPAGHRRFLATANVAWAREVWERHGPLPAEHFSGDTELDWRIRGAGQTLSFVPSAIVLHDDPPGLRRFWRERITRGRDFAQMRSASQGWSRARIAFYLAAMPAEPLIMLHRTLRDAGRAGATGEALATLPVIVLGHLAWAVGEVQALVHDVVSPGTR